MPVFIETVQWSFDKDRYDTLPQHAPTTKQPANTSSVDANEDTTHGFDAVQVYKSNSYNK